MATRVPKPEGWVGQRIPFYVDLRARGTFAGTASFALPRVPGTIVIKIGDPVVETEELEGENWFVQRHEFALFSQQSGPLEIPAFAVRFARREGYTGPATDVQAEAKGLAFDIRRPPGSEPIGFLITTEELDVTETWEPSPGSAEVGAVFKRTIVQRAPQIPGMALAPAPSIAPDGVRVYLNDALTNDKLARGEFLGERRETVTYLMQKAGLVELPAITYVWWNPDSEKLLSKTLPPAILQISPAVAPLTEAQRSSRHLWSVLFAALIGVAIWNRDRIIHLGRSLGEILHPPERAAFRLLVAACRKNDAGAAWSAFGAWRNLSPATDCPADVREASRDLMAQLYAKVPSGRWDGTKLANAVKRCRKNRSSPPTEPPLRALPPLNPNGTGPP